MEKVKKLRDVIDRLLGPDGCPWDREQTFESLRTEILEEAYELVDAIDSRDNDKIFEEVGDLLFMSVFLCKMGENAESFDLDDVADYAAEKYIRRHPHVFGEGEVKTVEEHLALWEKIKSKEKDKQHRTSALDDIPHSMQGLLRAQEVAKKFRKAGYSEGKTFDYPVDEQALGEMLLDIVEKADIAKIDVAAALNKVLKERERTFRQWEIR